MHLLILHTIDFKQILHGNIIYNLLAVYQLNNQLGQTMLLTYIFQIIYIPETKKKKHNQNNL